MRRRKTALPLAILFGTLLVAVVVALAVDDMRLRVEIQEVRMQAAIEKQSAIDSPFPPREWYEARIRQLEERLEVYES